MNVDLHSMAKGPEAAAKWQLLPPILQELSRFEFMTAICDGSQKWDLESIRIKRLEDGRKLITARVSMQIGEFSFAFFEKTGKSVLIDFHLYTHKSEHEPVEGWTIN